VIPRFVRVIRATPEGDNIMANNEIRMNSTVSAAATRDMRGGNTPRSESAKNTPTSEYILRRLSSLRCVYLVVVRVPKVANKTPPRCCRMAAVVHPDCPPVLQVIGGGCGILWSDAIHRRWLTLRSSSLVLLTVLAHTAGRWQIYRYRLRLFGRGDCGAATGDGGDGSLIACESGPSIRSRWL